MNFCRVLWTLLEYFCKKKNPQFQEHWIVMWHFHKFILVQYNETWWKWCSNTNYYTMYTWLNIWPFSMESLLYLESWHWSYLNLSCEFLSDLERYDFRASKLNSNISSLHGKTCLTSLFSQINWSHNHHKMSETYLRSEIPANIRSIFIWWSSFYMN